MGRPSVCVYCLKDDGENITVDHVIARSWYPTTSGCLPKWKAPACRTCNNRFSLWVSARFGQTKKRSRLRHA